MRAPLGITLLRLAALASGAAAAPKVLCIGFDGMDRELLDQYRAEGVMPNFDRFIAEGDYKLLGTAVPPQSPVAWSNFITGMNPGGHGIFDFIHRDPATMLPYLSAAQAMAPKRWWKLGNWKIPRDTGDVLNLRRGTAFWEPLADAGVDVTIFKLPANFPPVDCDVHSLSGMGTPDILGTYGIFSYYTDEPTVDTEVSGGRVIPVTEHDGRIETQIFGPINSYREGDPETSLDFSIVLDRKRGEALFDVAGEKFLMREGEWSEWLTLDFEIVPLVKSVSGVCRFYLMETSPSLRLYVTPINIDPAAPEMPISTPAGYSKDIAERMGPYYTQGLPDDTKALEEGVFDDDAYVSQSTEVLEERNKQFRLELERFAEQESGFLFFYYNSPDQTCHTFWRNMDHDSPMHDHDAEKHEGRIREIYMACDEVLGMALEYVNEETLVLAVSDHGFAPFHRAFHVNRWLLENGYLNLRAGVKASEVEYLSGIDWRRTRAYAIGINGLYLNQRERERRGTVDPDFEREPLLQELVEKLEAAVDPLTGERAIKYAYRTDEIYSGPATVDAPDIILGYFSGYRGSNESAMGEIPGTVFVDNMMKWSGDHCMAADEVPGVIISSRKIDKANPELLDLAPTFLKLFGLDPLPEMVGSSIFEGE
ncbi:alkaline phosphatase family protein [bacterium]|nr:alkaline phosphatase family protein [bacterium]